MPVYVRHEVVHNKYVVETLRDKGAAFVNELDEVPELGVMFGKFRRRSVLEPVRWSRRSPLAGQLVVGVVGQPVTHADFFIG